MKLELVEVRKASNVNGAIQSALNRAVRKTISNVYKEVVDMAPVDTGRLRNSTTWSIDGLEYGGTDSFPSTSPESPWGHKKGARPVGDPADMAKQSEVPRFPVNMDGNKVIGYVGNGVKRAGHAPYAFYQEYGWHDKNGNFHVQPFFRPAVYQYGVDDVVRPTFLRALRYVDFGPMKIERKKK